MRGRLGQGIALALARGRLWLRRFLPFSRSRASSTMCLGRFQAGPHDDRFIMGVIDADDVPHVTAPGRALEWTIGLGRFTEAWQDTGDTDMVEAFKAYQEVGFRGPIRPDHVPTMEGEDNSTPGYHMMGRLWALGYLRGLMAATFRE